MVNNQLAEVIYVESGKYYKAVIFSTRELDHMMGEDGEPLVDLGFFAPVLDGSGNEKKVIGTSDQPALANFRHDVPHTSHTFSEEAKALGHPASYPGGRWMNLSEFYLSEPQSSEAAAPEEQPLGAGPAGTETEVPPLT